MIHFISTTFVGIIMHAAVNALLSFGRFGARGALNPKRTELATALYIKRPQSTVQKSESSDTADNVTPELEDTNRELTVDVFRCKPNKDIIRALFVLRLCSYENVVKHGSTLMRYGQRVLGRSLFERCMRMTFYGQFVAGDTEQELTSTVTALLATGVRPIVMAPMEEDATDVINNSRYDENLRTIERCIELSHKFHETLPVSQLKLTALVPGQLIAKLSEHVPDPHGRPDLIDWICTWLVDGRGFLADGQTETLRKEPVLDMFNDEEQMHFCRSLDRLARVGEITRSLNVRLLVDAEYTYLNPALRLISLAMMLAYNKADGPPLVAYTYQNYLKKTFSQLQEDITFLENRDAGFGAKLVRGAYMNTERARARRLGYEDPVHASFEDTSVMYGQPTAFLLNKVLSRPDSFYFMVASHNEQSIKQTQKLMCGHDMPTHHPAVLFGQIFGMSDHLSLSLGEGGYYVYKSIPYGNVDDTLPYLQRRALENSGFLGRTATERRLLLASLKHRCTGRHRV